MTHLRSADCVWEVAMFESKNEYEFVQHMYGTACMAHNIAYDRVKPTKPIDLPSLEVHETAIPNGLGTRSNIY